MALDVAESTLKRRAEAHLRGVEGSRGAPEAAAAAGRRRQQQARAGERKKINLQFSSRRSSLAHTLEADTMMHTAFAKKNQCEQT
jgi:hypothetical protein